MDDREFSRLTKRDPKARALSRDERRNAEVVLSTYAAFPDRWNVEEQRAFYASGYVDHSPLHGRTFAELAAFVRGFQQNFPRGSVSVDRLLVDGDFVITHVTGRLSPDHPPQAAMEIFRFEDGRIAEHWDAISGSQGPGPTG